MKAVRSAAPPDEVSTLSGERTGNGSDAQPRASAAPAERQSLPPAAEVPTQHGPMGLRFDFNDGCRVMLPEIGDPWRVRLSDLDTGNPLFEIDLRSGHVNSTKRYFVRFRLEAWVKGESVLRHDYAATGRDVLIQFPAGTIGDLIGWVSYAVKFKELHRCRLTCALGEALIPLFRDAYPDITFLTHDLVRPERYYATYTVALFFDDHELAHQPCDFRLVGLHRTAAYILGVDPSEVPPRIVLADDHPPIPDPYVCIAVQSTTQNKYWNNPHGWREIVSYLRAAGYRVILHRPEARSRPRFGLDPHSPRRRRRDRRSAATRTRTLAQTRCIVCRPVQRPGVACLGGGDARGHDQRLYPPGERIFDSLSGHQLSRLQELLERRALPVRSPRFSLVPPSQGHPAPVRVHAADNGGSGEGDAATDPGFWDPPVRPTRCRSACMSADRVARARHHWFDG